ncbi:hypothetical protein MPSEU_000165800 [Mayamaea pseudoterrestris]|nr:hypothetical protein MPSEU_000165800 [Mayamaea pseudoterrestris]
MIIPVDRRTKWLIWSLGMLAMEIYRMWTLQQSSSFQDFYNVIAKMDLYMEPPPKVKHCYTNHCPSGYINKIVIPPIFHGGLIDRQYVFDILTNIGSSLCANVYVAHPTIMMKPYHNEQYPPVDESLPWSEFFNISHLDDHSQALYTYFNLSMFDAGNPFVQNATFFKRSEGDATCSDTTADYDQIVQFWRNMQQQPLEHQQGFVWTIQCPKRLFAWFRSIMAILDARANRTQEEAQLQIRSSRLPYHVPGCDYVKSEFSATVKRIAEKVWIKIKKVAGENSLFGTMHIRRGDAAVFCDTSLDALQKYLDCSLQNTSSLSESITFLFSSDEVDMNYRQQVFQLPQKMGSAMSHVKILDLDHFVNETLLEVINAGEEKEWLRNNYIVFAVIGEIQEQTPLRLTKRREYLCNSCDSIAEQYWAVQNNSPYWSYQCNPRQYCGYVVHSKQQGR